MHKHPVRNGIAKAYQNPLSQLSLIGLIVVLVLSACQGAAPTSTPSPLPPVTLTASATVTVAPTPTAAPVPLAQAEGKLAFSCDQDGNSEICVINADGTGLVNLTNHPANDTWPVWSPDGHSIAFWSECDGQGVYIMQSDGTQVTPLANTGPLDFPRAWSPDGRYLLLASYRDVNAEIYAIKTDGTSLVNLTNHPADDYDPAWSPDGAKIAFASDRDSETGEYVQIYVMDADGSDVVQITDFPKGAFCPVWSPDGQHIALSVVKATGDSSDVYVMEADGTHPRRLTNKDGWDYPQTWSPGGQYIVITRSVAETTEIFLVTIDGDLISRLPIDAFLVRWQPTRDLVPLIAVPVPTPVAEPAPPPPLALVSGTLIDGTGAEPIRDAVIVIRDGRIAAVGPRAETTIPADARVIDVQGGAILPGFINAHVHKAFDAKNLAAWAQAGVTTVRDLGAFALLPLGGTWDEWIQPIYEGHDVSPPPLFAYRDATLNHPQYARVVAAGPIVTVPGGYPIPNWGPELALTVNSPDDARQKVMALLDAGADVVKISLESGLRLSTEEVAAIVEVAHERGTIVTAHVSSARHVEAGVAAGIDDAAHMAVSRLSDDLIAQMVANDVYIVPTLAVLEAHRRLTFSLENLCRFVEAGGKVALGDDYGNPGIELGMPMREMELMQEGGMTPMQIIVAATEHGAHVCNLEEELGTLEVGKIADVLVVYGDPLQDIYVLADVQLVIRDGVVIRPADG